MSDATWLYAVGAPDTALSDVDLHGVAGERVRSVPCDRLTAVVGSVGLAEFGEEPLRRALQDPERVERIARAHHHVVEEVARRGATVPFRLATIYLGDERVRTFVTGNRAALAAVLRRVAGHAEWGVKAYLEVPDRAAGTAGSSPRAPSGTAYLLRRREDLNRREADWARAVARGDEIHAALAAVASASMRHPLPAEEAPSGPGRLVLHAAYLVGHAVAGRFADTVRRLSVVGTGLHLTGPWAAYSFTGPLGAGPLGAGPIGAGDAHV